MNPFRLLALFVVASAAVAAAAPSSAAAAGGPIITTAVPGGTGIESADGQFRYVTLDGDGSIVGKRHRGDRRGRRQHPDRRSRGRLLRHPPGGPGRLRFRALRRWRDAGPDSLGRTDQPGEADRPRHRTSSGSSTGSPEGPVQLRRDLTGRPHRLCRRVPASLPLRPLPGPEARPADGQAGEGSDHRRGRRPRGGGRGSGRRRGRDARAGAVPRLIR